MKFYLLLCFYLSMACSVFAQAPTIAGDTMLCPDTEGTAGVSGTILYDSYQWQVKLWGETEFTNIPDTNAPSFTYGAYEYSVTTIRVVVTAGTATYTSNELFIDGYAWAGLSIMHDFDEEQVTIGNNGQLLLCGDATVTNTVGMPYTIVQWYKNGEAISGATSPTFIATEPGEYYVVAAPGFCPQSTSTSIPFTIAQNNDCETPVVEAPVIAGENIMMCPWTESTAYITNEQTYDTYQWYYKYWFLDDEFEAIEGATSPTFDYDWYTYDQAIFKLVVTSGGETYESNTIQIDSYNWVSLTFQMAFSEGVVPDNETYSYLICDGDTITNTLPDLYSANVQWYRDGEPIEGANGLQYVITEPGSYYVSAGPNICPDPINNSNTMANPVVVSWNPSCTAGVNNPKANAFSLYPNPAGSVINLNLADTAASAYTIYDVTGKTLLQGSLSGTAPAVNIETLASGNYLIKVSGENGSSTKMFIKE